MRGISLTLYKTKISVDYFSNLSSLLKQHFSCGNTAGSVGCSLIYWFDVCFCQIRIENKEEIIQKKKFFFQQTFTR